MYTESKNEISVGCVTISRDEIGVAQFITIFFSFLLPIVDNISSKAFILVV